MRGKVTILVAERCENLTLSGLEFDFDRPTFSEITAVEKQASYWIGEVHQDSDYRITGGNRVQWFGEDWEDYHNMVQHFDHATGKVWRGGDPTAGASAVTDLGNRRLRFDGGSFGNVAVGRTLLTYETATVTAVTMSSDPKEQTITLDKEVTVAALNSDAVENVTWTPAVELINCDIRSIPTRGILLSTRRPILI